MGRHLERDVLALGYLVLNGRLGFAEQLAARMLLEHELGGEAQLLLESAKRAMRDEDPAGAEEHLRSLLQLGLR